MEKRATRRTKKSSGHSPAKSGQEMFCHYRRQNYIPGSEGCKRLQDKM